MSSTSVSLKLKTHSQLTQSPFTALIACSPPTLYLILRDIYLKADLLTDAPLCFVFVCLTSVCYIMCLHTSEKVDKRYQDVFISFY